MTHGISIGNQINKMHQNDIQLNQGKDTIEKANFLVFIKLFLL